MARINTVCIATYRRVKIFESFFFSFLKHASLFIAYFMFIWFFPHCCSIKWRWQKKKNKKKMGHCNIWWSSHQWLCWNQRAERSKETCRTTASDPTTRYEQNIPVFAWVSVFSLSAHAMKAASGSWCRAVPSSRVHMVGFKVTPGTSGATSRFLPATEGPFRNARVSLPFSNRDTRKGTTPAASPRRTAFQHS